MDCQQESKDNRINQAVTIIKSFKLLLWIIEFSNQLQQYPLGPPKFKNINRSRVPLLPAHTHQTVSASKQLKIRVINQAQGQ